MSRSFAVGCLLLISLSPASAQVRQWANSVSGLWSDATKWSPADAPDTTVESAVFDRFGTYNVSLPGGATTTVQDVDHDFGTITLRSDGAADAVLHASGDFRTGHRLTIAPIIGTTTDLVVDGTLTVESGSEVTAESTSILASTGSIAGGTSSDPTLVSLRDSSTATFGLLSIAASGSGANRGELEVIGDSVVETEFLRIATGANNPLGEVTILDGRLTQSGGDAVIGRSGAAIPGSGALAIGSDGNAEFSRLRINDSGQLRNAGGHLTIAESLNLSGGAYIESGAATRSFLAGTQVSVFDGARMALTNEPLTVAVGSVINVNSSTLESDQGMFVEAGGSATVYESVIDSTIELEAGSNLGVLGFSTTRVLGDFIDHGAVVRLDNLPALIFEGAYAGYGATGDPSSMMRFLSETSAGVRVGAAEIVSNAEWTETATLLAEIEGTSSYDRFQVGQTAHLGGTLAIELLDGFAPSAGDAFALLTADSLDGAFAALDAPTLADGLEWRIAQSPTSVTALVVAPSVVGDFNYDGVVDAADYTVWRDSAGSEGPSLAADANGDLVVDALDRAHWRASFGMSPPAATIPEPASASLLACATLCLVARLAIRP